MSSYQSHFGRLQNFIFKSSHPEKKTLVYVTKMKYENLDCRMYELSIDKTKVG